MASPRRFLAYIDYLIGNAKHLFIHIPKNAGVAIKRSPALKRTVVSSEPAFYASQEYVRELLSTMQANNEHHGYHHARLQDIHPNVIRNLQPIAVVRNPWSRTVSRYRFGRLAVEQGKIDSNAIADSFEGFLDERFRYGKKDFYWHRAIRGWFPQHDYVVDRAGNIAVHVLRQEKLSKEASSYFGFDGGVTKRNSSGVSVKPYQEYYTAKTEQVVADWYAIDIETFGFEFNSSATRNVYYETPPDQIRLVA